MPTSRIFVYTYILVDILKFVDYRFNGYPYGYESTYITFLSNEADTNIILSVSMNIHLHRPFPLDSYNGASLA